jgi:hypothetical protein
MKCASVYFILFYFTSVVHVNGLGLTLHVSVNPIMKFIYILCKCLIFIYNHVSVIVHVEHEMCKCKFYFILWIH